MTNRATIPFKSTANRDSSWLAALVWLAPAADCVAFQGVVGALIALLHRLHGFAGAVLDASDHLLDFLGRLRRAMGQRAHFVRHYRKATPGRETIRQRQRAAQTLVTTVVIGMWAYTRFRLAAAFYPGLYK